MPKRVRVQHTKWKPLRLEGTFKTEAAWKKFCDSVASVALEGYFGPADRNSTKADRDANDAVRELLRKWADEDKPAILVFPKVDGKKIRVTISVEP